MEPTQFFLSFSLCEHFQDKTSGAETKADTNEWKERERAKEEEREKQ